MLLAAVFVGSVAVVAVVFAGVVDVGGIGVGVFFLQFVVLGVFVLFDAVVAVGGAEVLVFVLVWVWVWMLLFCCRPCCWSYSID